jgi:hypothetical protein
MLRASRKQLVGGVLSGGSASRHPRAHMAMGNGAAVLPTLAPAPSDIRTAASRCLPLFTPPLSRSAGQRDGVH